MRRAAWGFIVAFGLVSCQQPDSEPLDQTFDLKVGQAIRLPVGDLELTFERVESDSRCPRNTTCVWAGEAVVDLVGRIGPDEPETLKMRLPAGGTAPDDTTLAKHYHGYRVQLLQLAPYPQSDLAPNPATYVVSLRVVKP